MVDATVGTNGRLAETLKKVNLSVPCVLDEGRWKEICRTGMYDTVLCTELDGGIELRCGFYVPLVGGLDGFFERSIEEVSMIQIQGKVHG